jgi:hypothetical protein
MTGYHCQYVMAEYMTDCGCVGYSGDCGEGGYDLVHVDDVVDSIIAKIHLWNKLTICVSSSPERLNESGYHWENRIVINAV